MMKGLSGSWIVLLVLLSSCIVSGLKSVLNREYKFSTYLTSWEIARHICRRNYMDLATFYSEADVKHLYLKRYYAWIGLVGDKAEWSDLVLSDGKTYLLHSWENQTSILQNAECAAAIYHVYYYNSTPLINKIYGLDCGTYRYFICEDIKGSKTEYIFIPKAMKWSEAQHYCKENYDELANINSSDLYSDVHEEDFPIWIGLHRDGGTWNWTVGSSEYNWKFSESSSNGDCVSISSVTHKMDAQNCDTYLPILCISDNVVLVKEEKSWEEALEHCRGLESSTNINLRYDLLSLQPEDDHVYVMRKVLEADTEEVWTGLRFLAGDWLWVNGADMSNTDLPICPAPGQHCGILSNSSAGKLEARDCSERKYFLCYSYKL